MKGMVFTEFLEMVEAKFSPAMVDDINARTKGHILTIEDPIEFVHHRKGCLISQREVGVHAPSFASAVHSALREDPDVILVGERVECAATLRGAQHRSDESGQKERTCTSSSIGSASVPCHFCLPSISVKDPSGNQEYAIQMPSCCGGLCVEIQSIHPDVLQAPAFTSESIHPTNDLVTWLVEEDEAVTAGTVLAEFEVAD
jgi:hypothetical protein